ncbi:MAG TPA: VWA domain-containing protein [Blastocatellia bacterium]|nr:VWA domain-containing protein [Blastocatellia bacterium]
MRYDKRKHTAVVLALVAAMMQGFNLHARAGSQQRDVTVAGREVTITVTVHPHNDRARANAAKLQPSDFAVREEKRPQQIISVKRASEVPLVMAVLIQDDLVPRVNNEIRGIKQFIRGLPEGSRVMTGYLTTGTLSVAQGFTTDLQRAAESLRIVRGTQTAAPFNPYVEVVEALRQFDSQPQGRRFILLVSDGLDASRGLRSASPSLSIDLDRAIREAQRRGVTVYTFFAPSTGLTSVSRLANNFGQGSLVRLADETGGEAFFTGTDFVSFDPYFKELNQIFNNQWVITYRSSNTGSDFREIEVTTEMDVHLHYPSGYKPAD